MLTSLNANGRRIRRRLAPHLSDDEAVQAFARDAVLRDDWAITDRQLFQVSRDGTQVRAVELTHLIGEVRQDATGVTFRLRSSRDIGVSMLGAFRKPNALTRHVQAVVDQENSQSG